MKRRLTAAEEFEIMKLVLDKFLWLGVGILGFAVFSIFSGMIADAVYYLIMGVVLLVIFLFIIVKEYEYAK